MAMTKSKLPIDLPPSLTAERDGDIALLRLSRPQKRNALDDGTVFGIETFFTSLARRTSGRWSCTARASISARVST